MPVSTTIPRASSALSRFTVLDLTRVRAGPTCARQLADWGANVIKIEAPERLEGGDPIGGARHGADFQNLHRNKRSITARPEERGRPRDPVKARRTCGRRDRELPTGRETASEDRLSGREGRQSAHRLCQHLGLRPGRPVRDMAGLRPDRPGHGRHHVGHRPARVRGRCGRALRSPTWRPGCSPRSAS